MPCSSGDEGYSNNYYYEKYELVTRIACELARIVKQSNVKATFSKETLKWIKAHELEDVNRIEKEKKQQWLKDIKKKALNKLTKAEKEALGILERK